MYYYSFPVQEIKICPLQKLQNRCGKFFSKDESPLKKHTTSEGYASLNTLLDMIPDTEKEIEVDILDEAVDGEATWVKYSTSYDGKPGVFKLVQEDDQWKVTHNGPREKGPF